MSISDQHLGDLKGILVVISSLTVSVADWGFVGAILTFVSTQSTDHVRAIEEARRDLEVFKKAYMSAERDKTEAEEKFEKEKKVLTDELSALRVGLPQCCASPQLM